jgi:hypothetical protein
MKKQISYEILKLNIYFKTERKFSWENERTNIVRDIKIEFFYSKTKRKLFWENERTNIVRDIKIEFLFKNKTKTFLRKWNKKYRTRC